ncbi:MAG TPA: SH3 domain-containing protein [Chloroflexota bacterium]|nr:SH3 domain-containing protein [Chloroflexota bacterium]
MNVQLCPGCGGRNTPPTESCDWCGRSFAERPRTFSIRWWQLGASVLFTLVVVAVVALAILNASRPDARAKPAQPAGAPSPGSAARGTDTAIPTRSATGLSPVDPFTGVGPSARLPTPTPAPPPTTTPTPPRYVRVFNTGGIGVNLRKDPGPQGQPIIAVPDNTILRLVGPEETVQARLWRLCEYEARGVEGWVPAEYIQLTDQVPTPARG